MDNKWVTPIRSGASVQNADLPVYCKIIAREYVNVTIQITKEQVWLDLPWFQDFPFHLLILIPPKQNIIMPF